MEKLKQDVLIKIQELKLTKSKQGNIAFSQSELALLFLASLMEEEQHDKKE